MRFKSRILRQAESELDEIFWWIHDRSPAGAVRWVKAFHAEASRICKAPYSQPLAPENTLVEFEVRHFTFKTRRGRKYRAIYTIVEDEVRILHILGSGQSTMTALSSPEDDESTD